MEKRDYIEAGRIVNTHGVAGEVKIEVWLDSPAFLKRFPRLFIEGRAYTVSAARVQKSFLLCRLEGVKTPFCDSICPIRQCGLAKGFETCGGCGELESCEKVGKIIKTNPGVLSNLRPQ